jgi:tape measure domain-containing protein
MALFGSDSSLQVVIRLKDEFSGSLKKIQSGLKSFQGDFEQSADASRKFALGLAAATTAAGAFAYQGIQTAAQLETNRQGFITLLGSAQKADAALAQIKKDAASTPFELPGLIQANQLLTSVTKDSDRSERFLLNIGKALAAMGKGQPEMDRLIVNLQQIGAVGKASMLDLKQFAFAGVPIFDMLKESMKGAGQVVVDNSKKIGTNAAQLAKLQGQLAVATQRQQEFTDKTKDSTKLSTANTIDTLRTKIAALSGANEKLAASNGTVVESQGQLEDMIASGAVTFEMLEDLFNKAGEGSGQFARAFIDQAGTFNQLFSNLKDNMNIFMADLVTQTGLFDLIKGALANFVAFLSAHSADIINFIKSTVEWLKEHKAVIPVVAGMMAGALAPAVIALGAAFAGMLIALAPFVAAGGALMLLIEGIKAGDPLMIGMATTIGVLLIPAIIGLATTIITSVLPALAALAVAAAPWLIGGLIVGGLVAGLVWVAKNWDMVWGGIKTGFKAAVNFLIGIAEGWANSWVGAANIIIGALNKVKFSIPDWVPGVGGKSFGINIPLVPKVELPRFEFGGTVPGARGQAVPILAHGGETVIPAGSSAARGGNTYSVVINNPVISSREDAANLRRQLEQALRDVSRGHKLRTI